MLLVCMGDSLTYGYGVDTQKCWVSLLKESSKSYWGKNIINKGINGNTTAAMLDRFHDDIISVKPTHVIILGGTNDFILNQKREYVLGNVELLCQDAMLNNITPILASPIPIYVPMAEKYWSASLDYSLINRNLCFYNDALTKFSIDNKLVMIDLFTTYINLSNSFSSLYKDGVHPNELGHEIIKNCFENAKE